jgi:hypothetical protein
MKFSISTFQREFLSIQKRQNLYSACLTTSLIASSVLTQLNIDHKVTPGFLSIFNGMYLDHFWIIANNKNYDFTMTMVELPENSISFHIDEPKGQTYAVESDLEKVERDALLSEWKKIRNLPIEVGVSLHFDGMSRMIGNQHTQAWDFALQDLGTFLGTNGFQVKLPNFGTKK